MVKPRLNLALLSFVASLFCAGLLAVGAVPDVLMPFYDPFGVGPVWFLGIAGFSVVWMVWARRRWGMTERDVK